MKNQKKLLLVGVVIFVVLLFVIAFLVFFNKKKETSIVDLPEAESAALTSYDLIDKDLENVSISLDDSVKQKFYAVFDEEKLNQKYKSDEIIEHPDLQDLVEQVGTRLKAETVLEIAKYTEPAKIEKGLVISQEDDDFQVLEGSDKEESSFIPEAHAAPAWKKVSLNSVVSNKYFNLYFQKGKTPIADVKQFSKDLQYAVDQYISWGYGKPNSEWTPQLTNLIGSIFSPDIVNVLKGKIGIYIYNAPEANWLGLTVSNPGWGLRDIAVAIGLFMDTNFKNNFEIVSELSANSVYPYININYDSIKNQAKRFEVSAAEVFKIVNYHEVFHLEQKNIGSKSDKFWLEHTAQWATLQLAPDSLYLAKSRVAKYYADCYKPFDLQDGKMEYLTFGFEDLLASKKGNDFIKESIKNSDNMSYLSKNADFKNLFHEFAVKNYLNDYDKKAISGAGVKPKISKTLEITKDKKEVSAENISIDRASIQYAKVKLPSTERPKNILVTVEESGTTFNGQIKFSAIGIKGSIQSLVEGKVISKTQDFNIDTNDLDSVVFAITNASYLKDGTAKYTIKVKAEGQASEEPALGDNVKSGAIDTVIVIDGSGSMYDMAALTDSKDMTKKDASTKASTLITSLIEKESKLASLNNKIGVVAFADSAKTVNDLSTDYSKIKEDLISISVSGGTNIGDGLEKGVGLLEKSTAPNKVILLLTDGQSNTGLSRQEIISGPTAIAKSKGINIYTIGFDTSESYSANSSVDSALLYAIARDTGGKYYFVQKVGELTSAFTDLYHSSTGQILSSVKGNIKQGETKRILLNIPEGTGTLRATVTWPGSKLEMKLIDPSGRVISKDSSRVDITGDKDFEDLAFRNPKSGQWQIEVAGVDVPEEELEFYFTSSAQTKSKSDFTLFWDWVSDNDIYFIFGTGLVLLLVSTWTYLLIIKRNQVSSNKI